MDFFMETKTREADGRKCELMWYAGVRLFQVLFIAGIGWGSMYFADDCCHRITVGLCYLVAMGAVITVILGDQLDRDLRKRFLTKR